jgi:hypothetical protein
MGIKGLIQFAGVLRPLWKVIKDMAGSSPMAIFTAGQKAAAQINPEFGRALSESQELSDFKRCGNMSEVQDLALSLAEDKVPFFKGKSRDEIKDYIKSTGESLGYL